MGAEFGVVIPWTAGVSRRQPAMSFAVSDASGIAIEAKTAGVPPAAGETPAIQTENMPAPTAKSAPMAGQSGEGGAAAIFHPQMPQMGADEGMI